MDTNQLRGQNVGVASFELFGGPKYFSAGFI